MHRTVVFWLLLVASGGTAASATTGNVTVQQGSRTPHRVVELATELKRPWSIAFLPGGALLIAERNGGIRVFRQGALDPQPLTGVPPAFVSGDGGILGLALHPSFGTNHWLYACESSGTEESNASRVFRGRLENRALEDVQIIFTARPTKRGGAHFGCRLVFAPDGTLLVAIGDGYDYRDQAQRLDSDLGKVLRLGEDGSVPPDNPFVRREGALPEIYTLGHRNPQGLVLQPRTGEVWLHEHGARGGDEINVLRSGANYGWPLVTYGIDYSGAPISAQTQRAGFEPPVFYWVPSIAPSGMDFYDGDRFPEWRGDLFVGALGARALFRLDLEGGRIVGQEILLADRKERIREVRSGPDGLIYVLTDADDGKLLRLEPAN